MTWLDRARLPKENKENGLQRGNIHDLKKNYHYKERQSVARDSIHVVQGGEGAVDVAGGALSNGLRN